MYLTKVFFTAESVYNTSVILSAEAVFQVQKWSESKTKRPNRLMAFGVAVTWPALMVFPPGHQLAPCRLYTVSLTQPSITFDQ